MTTDAPFSVVLAEDDNMFRLMEMGIRREPNPAGRRVLDYFFGAAAGRATEQLLAFGDEVGLSRSARATVCTNATELAAALADADVLVVEAQPVTENELRHAGGRLKVVQKFGTVTDHIDLAAAAARGVAVRTQSRLTTISCAEHVLALLLALSRRLLAAHAAVVDGPATGRPAAPTGQIRTSFNWGRVEGVRLLHGRTLGLVGFGEIARQVAVRALAFGMKVIYHKRQPVDQAQLPGALAAAEPVGFDELLTRSDVVSVHVPSTPATEHLIGAAALARIRPTAWLVNMSRGEIVDETALEAALRGGRLAGAALDVYREEPVPTGSGLLRLDNVVWSPHLAAGSEWFVLDEVRATLALLARLEQGVPAPGSEA